MACDAEVMLDLSSDSVCSFLIKDAQEDLQHKRFKA